MPSNVIPCHGNASRQIARTSVPDSRWGLLQKTNGRGIGVLTITHPSVNNPQGGLRRNMRHHRGSNPKNLRDQVG